MLSKARGQRGKGMEAVWLTCRFIDEFGRTFVRRDFNTIEGVSPLLPPRRDVVAARPPSRKKETRETEEVARRERKGRGIAIWYCNGTSSPSIGHQPEFLLVRRLRDSHVPRVPISINVDSGGLYYRTL